jgi:hypothetical protein
MKAGDRTRLLFGPSEVPALKSGGRATRPCLGCVKGR